MPQQNEKEIHIEDELRQEMQPEIRHLKTKPVPAIVMLLAGLVAAVYTFIQGMDLLRALVIILVTLLIFWIIGGIIKILLDKIEIIIPVEGADMEDGEGEDGSEEDTGTGEEVEPGEE